MESVTIPKAEYERMREALRKLKELEDVKAGRVKRVA